MTFTQHSALSGIGSAAIVTTGGDIESAAAFFVMGVFIDIDHVPDYWRDTGINFRVREFLSFFASYKATRLWLPLHGWEWPAMGFVTALQKGSPDWVLWGLAGWSFHLVLDQIFNGLHPLGYFFSFRAAKAFDSVALTGSPPKA